MITTFRQTEMVSLGGRFIRKDQDMLSDSEADDKSYESYDNNSDDDFKEEFEDEDYDEPSVKPRIKIGPIIDEDVADDQEEMEYGGMELVNAHFLMVIFLKVKLKMEILVMVN